MKKIAVLITTAIALTFALMMAACSPAASTTSSSSGSSSAQTGIANPWSDAATAQEAAEGAGVGEFNLLAENTMVENGPVNWDSYHFMEGIAQADGYVGAGLMSVRKGLPSAAVEKVDGVNDISGDYNEYDHSWELDANGTTIHCYSYEEGRTMKAIWESSDYCYAMLLRSQGDDEYKFGLGDNDIKTIASSIS